MIPKHRTVKDPNTKRPLGVLVELKGQEYDPIFSGELDWAQWMYCSQGVALSLMDHDNRIVFADADSVSRSVLESNPKLATDLACSVVVDLGHRLSVFGPQA